MTLDEIATIHGTSALERLYDHLLDMPSHELASMILEMHTPDQIREWIQKLTADDDVDLERTFKCMYGGNELQVKTLGSEIDAAKHAALMWGLGKRYWVVKVKEVK